MSELSEKTRKGLYAKLNVSSVTSLATKGVHFMVAADATKPPFVVFSRVPKSIIYGLANNLVVENDLWLIKAITDKDSHGSKSPASLAEEILKACETAIGGNIVLDGGTNLMARRVLEIPNYIETQGDRNIFHAGFYLETFTS